MNPKFLPWIVFVNPECLLAIGFMALGKTYQRKGDTQKQTLVCLHGFLGTGADFKIVTDHYPNHPTLLAPDFPNYHDDPVTSEEPWTSILDELDHFIKDACADRPCVLLGYSMGGRIALKYALKHQERLQGLILIGATPGLREVPERAERIKQDADRAKDLLNQSNETFLNAWSKQALIQTQNRIKEPYSSRMRKARLSNNQSTLAYYLISLGTGTMSPAWEQLKDFKLHTLLLTGSEDKKFTSIAAEMKKLMPNAQHEIIEAAGHAACFENPSQSVEVIEAFLKTMSS